MMQVKLFTLVAILIVPLCLASAQDHKNEVYVDPAGVLRWPDNGEVMGFGVNYTAPFAHAYRSANKLGVPIREAIKNDVYHFARLGFDAYRVHVWDTEISDTLGNLLVNDHLDTFDYMLSLMKERGMKFILTPIAFWGNGWPEPDEKTPGFAHKYGKDGCLTIPEAIKAQGNYLEQFMNHVNPYTGIAYKDDADIVAIEISNEPHHRGSADEVTAYVKRMVEAVKASGCAKPVLYNISHGINYLESYYDAGIDGGTFQWYPTGLGAQEALQGNFLLNVDRYDIPYKDVPDFKNSAKIVYEFDAADVANSYIYPAMARSFRAAGIQWATHFAYDPTYLAYANTEYNTHYMNLVYAPQKAISLMITGEVFHQIPMYSDYGAYPNNTKFGDFTVDYENDLAMYNSETKFYYTNSHQNAPKNEQELERVAGYGNSPIVKFAGLGAYFLDKVDKGIWRLEVMPDALWAKNLFGRNSLDKQVTYINWREWSMNVNLQDLGTEFEIEPLNQGNEHSSKVQNGSFTVRPGTYLLRKKGRKLRAGKVNLGNIKLSEYFAAAGNLDQNILIHKPAQVATATADLNLSLKYYSVEIPDSIELWISAGWNSKRLQLENTAAYEYSITLPAEILNEGMLNYYFVVHHANDVTTYPSKLNGRPYDWDTYDRKPYSVQLVDEQTPLYLFNAKTDFEELNMQWDPGVRLVPTDDPDKLAMQVNIRELFKKDPENPAAEPIYDYSIRHYFGDKLVNRQARVKESSKLIIRGRSLNEKNCPIALRITTLEGVTHGNEVMMTPELRDYVISLDSLEPVDPVTLPRPYPTFLPYYFDSEEAGMFNLELIEALQLSIGPGLNAQQRLEQNGVLIESIRIE